jgi:hypothetical protein
LVGVIVGAILQFVFSKYASGMSKNLDNRLESYAKFTAISDFDNPNLSHQVESRYLLLARGSDKVVSAVLEYEKLGGYIESHEQKKAFVQIFREIRKDCRGRRKFSDEELFLMSLYTKWEEWDKGVKKTPRRRQREV